MAKSPPPNHQKYMYAPGHGRTSYDQRERVWYHDGNVYSSYSPDGPGLILPSDKKYLDDMIAKGILIPSDVTDVKILVEKLLKRTAKYEENHG